MKRNRNSLAVGQDEPVDEADDFLGLIHLLLDTDDFGEVGAA